jgi:hypothetical protein
MLDNVMHDKRFTTTTEHFDNAFVIILKFIDDSVKCVLLVRSE